MLTKMRTVHVRDMCLNQIWRNLSKEQVETWLTLISIDRYVTITILSEFMYLNQKKKKKQKEQFVARISVTFFVYVYKSIKK